MKKDSVGAGLENGVCLDSGSVTGRWDISNSRTYPIDQSHVRREQSLGKAVTVERDLKIKGRRAEGHLLNQIIKIIRIRTASSQRRSHLCNKQIFRERRKANDLLEQPLPLILSKEVPAND
jgi:hypothetical protein